MDDYNYTDKAKQDINFTKHAEHKEISKSRHNLSYSTITYSPHNANRHKLSVIAHKNGERKMATMKGLSTPLLLFLEAFFVGKHGAWRTATIYSIKSM